MSVQPLRSAKDITKVWIQNMLSAYYHSEIEVLQFSSILPTTTQGFLSEISFLTVEHKCNSKLETSKFVLKFLPTKQDLITFMDAGGLAKREVDFYKFSQNETFQSVCKLAEVDHLVPKVFYSGLNLSSLTIVMEDLRELNYELVVVQDGSNLKETISTLRAIALVHAAGVIHKNRCGKHEIDKITDNEFYDQFLIPNLKMLSQKYECESKRMKEMASLVPFTKQMRKWHQKFPLIETVVHGDLWAAQTLYSPCRNKSCLLDWQFCTIGNPVIDIQAMFFMSSNASVLENHLEEVLTAYWESFTESLSKHEIDCPISFQQLKDNVENMWISGFLYLAVSIHDFLDGDGISDERLEGLLRFLEKRNVLSQFIQICQSEL